MDFLDRSAPTLRVAGLVAAQEEQLAAFPSFPNERPLRWPRSTQLVAPASIKDGITAVTPEKAARPPSRVGAEFDYPVDEWSIPLSNYNGSFLFTPSKSHLRGIIW